jgi:hypothetical protein
MKMATTITWVISALDCIPNTPEGADYVVTEDDVLGWCWANGVDKDATEAAVEQQIQNQIDPPVVSLPLPWAA